MLEKIKEMVEGWRNHLIPAEHLKEAINSMSEERMAICNVCQYNSVNAGTPTIVKSSYCKLCGCPLAAKTKSPTSACPLQPPKWDKYMDMHEYEKLNKQNDGQDSSP